MPASLRAMTVALHCAFPELQRGSAVQKPRRNGLKTIYSDNAANEPLLPAQLSAL
jgi:hypothetical protein